MTKSIKRPLAFAFGGGRDGTALLFEFKRRGIVPDRIQFADTGNRDSEKPETYVHIDHMAALVKDWWDLDVVWVRNDGVHGTLENECFVGENLPSLVFGFRGCSDKYKQRPMHKDLQAWATVPGTKAIGYNASEAHRATKIAEDRGWKVWYPLIEWGITRRMVGEICLRELGYMPPKSACFFCPASKKHEVIWLSRNHPELFERAVAMERRFLKGKWSEGTVIKGLGRHWSWAEVVKADEQQLKLLPETTDMPCICFDDADEEEEDTERILEAER